MVAKKFELSETEKQLRGICSFDIELPFEKECMKCGNLKITKKKIKVIKKYDPNEYEANLYTCEHAEFCRSISHVFKKYEIHKRKENNEENNDAPKPIMGMEDDEL